MFPQIFALGFVFPTSAKYNRSTTNTTTTKTGRLYKSCLSKHEENNASEPMFSLLCLSVPNGL
jgi:hypothetical protein